ncbi:MAG: C40 family peptidase [Gammaproteobacteria bacterium]
MQRDGNANQPVMPMENAAAIDHENRLNGSRANDLARSATKAAVRLVVTLGVVAACSQLCSCGTLPSETPVATTALHLSPAAVVVRTARRGFDCSGLVHYAYQRAGIKVPRTTSGLLRRAHRVALSKLRPGDVLFFRVDPPKISHVGIYIGHGEFVHAPSSGKQVSYASLKNNYWSHHVISAGRFY